ncbi:hypothetical protein BH10ACI1_BH10ACI1_10750 [soil metagenome]
MTETHKDLGKLESIHGISPAILQRAVFIAVLSFVFFLAMMLAFYVRQNVGYFLLSTAFLLVYIATMFNWVMIRKNVLKMYEKGFSYKDFKARWNEIESVTGKNKNRYEICKKNGKKIVVSEAILGIKDVIEKIRGKQIKIDG